MLGTDSKARVFAPSPSRKIAKSFTTITAIGLIAAASFSGRLMAQDGKILASLSGKIGEVTVVDSKKEAGFPPYFVKDGSIPKEYFSSGNKLVLPDIDGVTTTVVSSNSSIAIAFTDMAGIERTAKVPNVGEVIGNVYWMGRVYLLSDQNKLVIVDISKQISKDTDLTSDLAKVGVDFRNNASNIVFMVALQNGIYVLGIGSGNRGMMMPVDSPVSEPLTER